MVTEPESAARGRRRFLRSLAPAMAAPALSACSLIDISDTSTKRDFDYEANLPSCPIGRVGFVKPVVSMSMGISEFEEREWSSKSAHALGANMMFELLRPQDSACLDLSGAHGRCDAFADASLRMRPGGEGTQATLWMLKMTTQLDYGWRIHDSPSSIKPAADGRWLYFGNGERMSRRYVLERVRGICERARRVADVDGSALLVVYLCTHGVIDARGRAWLIPSDASATDHASWLAFDDVLAPVFDYALREPNPDQRRQAIVFFDCCQRIDVASPASVKLVDTLPEPPPGVALVTAVSPGQWAWHFATRFHVAGNVDVSNRGLMGLPLPAAERTGHLDDTYDGFLSVLPMATRCAMSMAADAFDEQYGSDPTVKDAVMTVDEWISGVRRNVTDLLEVDPVRQQAGGTQDVRMKLGNPFGPPVLRVVRKKA